MAAVKGLGSPTSEHVGRTSAEHWGRAERVSFEWSMLIGVVLAGAGALSIVYLGVFWCLPLLGGAVVLPVATWQNIRGNVGHGVVARH